MLSLSKIVRYTIAALLLCAVLAFGQRHLLFPNAGTFYSLGGLMGESHYVSAPKSKADESALLVVGQKVRNLVLTSAVAPRPFLQRDTRTGTETLTNQVSPLATYGLLGGIAALAWLATLGLSLVSLVLDRRITPVILALIGFVVGQICLHAVYGSETFLYAADHFVVLMLLACLGAGGRWRRAHMVALACFIVTGAITNVQQFKVAAGLANDALDNNQSLSTTTAP